METNFSLLLLPGTRWNQVSHWAWPEPAMGSLRVWLEHSGVGTAVLRQAGFSSVLIHQSPTRRHTVPEQGWGPHHRPQCCLLYAFSVLATMAGPLHQQTPSSASKVALPSECFSPTPCRHLIQTTRASPLLIYNPLSRVSVMQCKLDPPPHPTPLHKTLQSLPFA